MPKSELRVAIAVAAVAAAIVERVLPGWFFATLFAAAGLVAAGVFVWKYCCEPASLESLTRLRTHAILAVASLMLGSGFAFDLLLPQKGSLLRDCIWGIVLCAFVAASIAIVIWHRLAVRNYRNARPARRTSRRTRRQLGPAR